MSKGLYEIGRKADKADKADKITLKIYFSQPGGERPKKIEETVAEGHFLWVLEKSQIARRRPCEAGLSYRSIIK